MPRRDGPMVRVTVRGAGTEDVGSFTRNQRAVQDELNRHMNVMGQRVTKAIKESEATPEDTGLLKDSIRPFFFTRAHQVQVTIKADPRRDGYNYADVTRFGHRKVYIRPKRLRRIAGKGSERFQPALRFRSDMTNANYWAFAAGRTFPQVRGVRVRGDWLDAAMKGALIQIYRTEQEMGRAVVGSILGGSGGPRQVTD